MSGGLECATCFLKFGSQEELANHKGNFCAESEWYDPFTMKASLEAEQAVDDDGKKALTFEEVRQYLKVRMKTAGDPALGPLSLNDLRKGFRKDEKDLEILHSHISKQRELEKASELRQLKIHQQKMRALKTQEEREVRNLMLELEKRKDLELRQRLEKEMVKRELRGLDAVQMKALEMERRAEIAKLARERGALKHREDDLVEEVHKLEGRMQDQEMKFRQQQSAVDQYFEENKKAGKSSMRHEQMQLAQHRGQRAAHLREQRKKLIENQQLLLSQAKQMKVPVISTVSTLDLNTQEYSKAAQSSARDELELVIGGVQAQIGEENARLQAMKKLFKADMRKMEEEQIEIDTELGKLNRTPQVKHDASFSVLASDVLSNFGVENNFENDKNNILNTVRKPLETLVHELDDVVLMSGQKMKRVVEDTPFQGQTTSKRSGGVSPQNPTMSGQHDVANVSDTKHKDFKTASIENVDTPGKFDQFHLSTSARDQSKLDLLDDSGKSPFAHQASLFVQSIDDQQREQPLSTATDAPGTERLSVGGGGQVAVMMLLQQQQQIQMTLLKRQEEANKRIQQEMEAMLRTNEDAKLADQQMDFQRTMRDLLTQVNKIASLPHYTAPLQLDTKSLRQPMITRGQTAPPQIPDSSDGLSEHSLRALELLPKDSELYNIQIQHLAALTKMKFEMEQLTQEQRLFELKSDLNKKKKEHDKEKEHDEFMAEKRRQLRAARIQRILAKEMPGELSVGAPRFSSDYDPNLGFTIFFDFSLEIPSRYRKLQIVYCFAVGTEQKTKVRALPIADCEPDASGNHQCIIGMSRDIKKVPPINYSRCVIEVQNVDEMGRGKDRNESIGWCAVDLFTPSDTNPLVLALNAGFQRLPLQRGQVDFRELSLQKLPATAHVSMFVRLCTAIDTESFKNMSLDPAIATPRYTYPSNVLNVPKSAYRTKNESGDMIPDRKKRGIDRRKRIEGDPPKAHSSNIPLTRQKPVPSAGHTSVKVGDEVGAKEKEEIIPKKPRDEIMMAPQVTHRLVETGPVKKMESTKDQPERPKEWENGLGIYIRSLEKSYLGAEVVSFKVRATVYNQELQPLVVNDAKACIETPDIEINYDDPKNRPDGYFEFLDMQVVPLGEVDAFNSYLVFEIFDEEGHKRYWTATNIVYDDQVHDAIDKSIKHLRMYRGAVLLPPSQEELLKEDNAELIIELYNPNAPPSKRNKSETNARVNTAEKQAAVSTITPIQDKEDHWFIEVDNGDQAKNRQIFTENDAFDVYIDAVRFLPASVTISKMNVTLLTEHFDIINACNGKDGGEKHRETIVHVTQEAYSPKVDLRIEYRQKEVDQTSALCIRVDTVDELTRELQIVGYAHLNIFSKKGGREAPQSESDVEYCLNAGCHQIPIYLGAPKKTIPWNVNNLRVHPRIPCASLLVRIVSAPKHPDTNKILSIYDENISAEQHEELGLYIPAPMYKHMVYDSVQCKPQPSLDDGAEIMTFEERYNEPDAFIPDRAQYARRGKSDVDNWNPEDVTDDFIEEWISKRFHGTNEEPVKHTQKIMNPQTVTHYTPTAGFLFNIIGGWGYTFSNASFMSKGGEATIATYRVIDHMTLKDDEGLENAYFTDSQDWDAPYHYPTYKSEKKLFHLPYVKHAIILIEIFGVEIIQSKKKDVLKQKNLGFSILPLWCGNHKLGEESYGFVNSGYFKLPLFRASNGVVPKKFLEAITGEDQTKILERETNHKSEYNLKVVENGAHVHVQLIDRKLLGLKSVLLPAKRSKNTYLPSDPKLLYEQKESVLAKELKAKKTVKSLIKGRNMLPEFYQQKLNKLFSEKNKTKLMVPNLKEH